MSVNQGELYKKQAIQNQQDQQYKQNHQQDQQEVNEESHSLKGTLFSVMVVGAFIGLMWAGIFWLYMERF